MAGRATEKTQTQNLQVIKMKKDILRAANYGYNFDRDIYFNRKTKKAFSLEFVDDHSEDELKRRIAENTGGNGWIFYFNSTPSEGVKRELERVLG
jgi:hypothetical protein